MFRFITCLVAAGLASYAGVGAAQAQARAPVDAALDVGVGSPAGYLRSDFVKAEGVSLTVEGRPYRFSGTNSYQMLESTWVADQYLAAARELGLNTVRMWAFSNCQAPRDRNACLVVNDAPGQWPPRLDYPEEAWRRLDYVLERAGALGLRLILPLANYWDEFGGIQLLAQWAGLPPESRPYYDREEFYRSGRARELYASYVERITSRVNHRTGVRYRDDPTILMWEPMNEARGRSDASGRTVADWLDWAGSVIKSHDSRHLVGSGTEGFFASYAPGEGDLPSFDYGQYAFQASRHNVGRRRDPSSGTWQEDALVPEGSYFPDVCDLPHIDACSLHAWPYNWYAVDQQPPETFMLAWGQAHARVMRERNLQKPLYLGEFGLQVSRGRATALEERDRVFTSAFEVALREKMAGAAFWHLALHHPGHGGLSFDVVCRAGDTSESTCGLVRRFSGELTRALRF